MQTSSQPTSVVLGGAGFVGSHLCHFLIGKGHRVTCVDNLATGRTRNIDQLLRHTDFDFVRHDIREPIELEGAVDYVYNMASPASPKHYFELPILTLETGAIGTRNALDFTRAKGARMLLASTSEVYGDPQVHPQVESYWGYVNPIGPRSVYDEAKRFAEAITMAYHRERETDAVIVRIFNTYGPGMRADDGRALPAFISQALSGSPLTIHGDGKQTRSFCYVEDLVRGLYAAATSDSCGPINLGNPAEITIAEFAREVIELTGSASELTFHPRPTDDPSVRKPDISKAREILGWEPAVSRKDGLARTIAYFRGELEAQVQPQTRPHERHEADRPPVPHTRHMTEPTGKRIAR